MFDNNILLKIGEYIATPNSSIPSINLGPATDNNSWFIVIILLFFTAVKFLNSEELAKYSGEEVIIQKV